MTDFTATRALFDLPEGLAYLDGNSLGPLARSVPDRVARAVREEWGRQLIRAWNDAGWMEMPDRLGDRIAPLIGAPAGTVTTGDTLSIKLHQALSAALTMTDRPVILSDTGNFPSDLYIADAVARQAGGELRTVAPEAVAAALSEEIGVLMLTEVDYRTGRLHDMVALTARAKSLGIATVWDLAHSAGALPVDVAGAGADFAVGCSYKYLNGGPGAPAFVYAAPDVAGRIDPSMPGWLGHAAPFAFEPGYRPARDVARFRVGTPPVLQMAALDAALDVWDVADIVDVRARSLDLSERLIAGVEAACPDLALASPRDGSARGSQVSFSHPEAYPIMQALIARGVIGDFRAPDILRFGLTPLYLGEAEIDTCIATLAEVMDRRLWDDPAYRQRQAVT
ncbi:Kynureninase [Palleronia marisminoris]|uniref:Kynureninase n=1 Tax=Palleronia marisminoris TaxID=315423 RepID=A0A1Y5RLV1_9RHOB|nr:kynureninase [Palleronia marisminoris]SFG22119.1 Kynureninase [Palleronia marisminoris]SLN17662.1 Kynureninase [Palleronia marisminoris]